MSIQSDKPPWNQTGSSSSSRTVNISDGVERLQATTSTKAARKNKTDPNYVASALGELHFYGRAPP